MGQCTFFCIDDLWRSQPNGKKYKERTLRISFWQLLTYYKLSLPSVTSPKLGNKGSSWNSKDYGANSFTRKSGIFSSSLCKLTFDYPPRIQSTPDFSSTDFNNCVTAHNCKRNRCLHTKRKSVGIKSLIELHKDNLRACPFISRYLLTSKIHNNKMTLMTR